MVLYACTIFLSAFLLFQVQPVIARIILPWFGGSAAVWTTCMLFFQCVLVLGYLYAHWITSRLPPRAQALLHGALVMASAIVLPVTPDASWKLAGGENPVPRILGLLSASVGLPYLVLSTTGPLLQAWYVRSREGAVPYRLFALSNLGSMLALLSYPALVEPTLATRTQALAWSGGYIAFAALCLVTAFVSLHAVRRPQPAVVPAPNPRGDETSAPGLLTHVIWLSLAACASTLLLAVTNYMCQDVAAIPFLWILPLSLYLLTFILCFDAEGWYRRNVYLVLLGASLIGMAVLANPTGDRPGMKYLVPLLAAGFFCACMFCHGELARLKPNPRYLTSFYLMISLGGALGGLFVGIAAPEFFPAYLEFPAALACCAILAAVVLHRDEGVRERWAWRQHPSPTLVILAAAVITVCAFDVLLMLRGAQFTGRNFYGALRVQQEGDEAAGDAYRTLLNGVINHGGQWQSPKLRGSPTSYYFKDTGVGQALNLRAQNGPRRVGIIGLGTGTLNAYAKPGDTFRIYEINPLVVEIAKHYFTYLGDSRATTEIVLGDARQSLERERPQNFDVLAVDAFSSDSIPVHLLTREAFRLYFLHLKPDGLLAVHITNRYLNLIPVVDLAARDLHKAATRVETESSEGHCYGTTWIVLANDARELENLPKHNGRPLQQQAGLRMWTDDYSNLFQILK